MQRMSARMLGEGGWTDMRVVNCQHVLLMQIGGSTRKECTRWVRKIGNACAVSWQQRLSMTLTYVFLSLLFDNGANDARTFGEEKKNNNSGGEKRGDDGQSERAETRQQNVQIFLADARGAKKKYNTSQISTFIEIAVRKFIFLVGALFRFLFLFLFLYYCTSKKKYRSCLVLGGFKTRHVTCAHMKTFFSSSVCETSRVKIPNSCFLLNSAWIASRSVVRFLGVQSSIDHVNAALQYTKRINLQSTFQPKFAILRHQCHVNRM